MGRVGPGGDVPKLALCTGGYKNAVRTGPRSRPGASAERASRLSKRAPPSYDGADRPEGRARPADPPAKTFPENTTDMRIPHFSTLRAGLVALALALLALGGGPAALTAQDAAQQTASADTSVSEEEMGQYVDLQLRIDALQEEAIQEMVRIHSESGRAQIRGNLTEAIAAAHEEHAITPERFKTITFLVSSDEAARELFDRIMADRQGEGGGEAGGEGG